MDTSGAGRLRRREPGPGAAPGASSLGLPFRYFKGRPGQGTAGRKEPGRQPRRREQGEHPEGRGPEEREGRRHCRGDRRRAGPPGRPGIPPGGGGAGRRDVRRPAQAVPCFSPRGGLTGHGEPGRRGPGHAAPPAWPAGRQPSARTAWQDRRRCPERRGAAMRGPSPARGGRNGSPASVSSQVSWPHPPWSNMDTTVRPPCGRRRGGPAPGPVGHPEAAIELARRPRLGKTVPGERRRAAAPRP